LLRKHLRYDKILQFCNFYIEEEVNMRKDVFRKGIVVAIICLFIGTSVAPTISGTISNLNGGKFRGLTITTNQFDFYVDDDYNSSHPGWQVTHFDYITDAIEASSESNSIGVYNGTYFENVVIDKKLFLVGMKEDDWGDDKNGSIIIGASESGTILVIGAGGTGIENFIINNDNIRGRGISISNSPNIRISMNKIQFVHTGVELSFSESSEITGNNISYNDRGIYMKISDKGHIEWNHIKNSRIGIEMYDSQKCHIYKNQIKNITGWDIWIAENRRVENQIYENNFINNTRPRRFRNSINSWYDNYWSDWRGLKGLPGVPPFYVIGGLWRSEEIEWLVLPIPTLDNSPQEEPYKIPDDC
jgi:parallel beta-helix repeat protein